jgi:hypothetical protein
MDLHIMTGTLAVCRLDPGARVPGWASGGILSAIIRTPEELSIVCEQENVPPDIRCERNWRAMKVAGPLDFALIGVLASMAGALADAGVSVFALSTYDTDYLLVKADTLERAIDALEAAGHRVADG